MRSARRTVGGMPQEKGSRGRCRSWIVLHAIGFTISQGNAEAPER